MQPDLLGNIGGSAALTSAASLQSERTGSNISIDDFLKILAASMRNPSMGGDSSGNSNGTDYISQMVQFTSLEQLNQVSDTLTAVTLINQQQQAFQLLGKPVKVMNESGEETSGVVEKVRFQEGYGTLVVDGKEYRMSALREVSKQDE